MKPIPPELAAVIDADDCVLSDKATKQYLRFGYTDADAAEVAGNGFLHKKKDDVQGIADYVWTLVGRDTSGRSTYMSGKVAVRYGIKTWYIITIHPADEPRSRLRGRRGKVRQVPQG